MSAPDFAAILEPVLADAPLVSSHMADVHRLLAAKVPELCRTCDGQGFIGDPGADYIRDACPDCPTIGQLLAIGAEAFDHRDYLWAAGL